MLWTITHKRDVALSLMKSLYNVYQYDYENVRASQYRVCALLRSKK